MKKRIFAFLLVFIMLASLFPSLAFASAKPTISIDDEIIGGSTTRVSSSDTISTADIPNLIGVSFTCSSTTIFLVVSNAGDTVDSFSGEITIGDIVKPFSFTNIPFGVNTYPVTFNMRMCSERITVEYTGIDEGVIASNIVTGSRAIPTNEVNEWSYGGKTTKQECIEYHFKKHGMQTGNFDIRSYILDAISFRSNFSLTATGTLVSGITPNVYRFRQGNYYIDLQRPNPLTNLIVSYGTR